MENNQRPPIEPDTNLSQEPESLEPTTDAASQEGGSKLKDLLIDGVAALDIDEITGSDDAKSAFADRLKKMGYYK